MKYLIVMLLMLTGCSKEPQVADDFQPSPPVKHPPAPEPEWGTNSQGILSSLKFGSHIVDARDYVGFLAEDRKAYFLRVVNATNRFPGVKPGRVHTIEGTTIVEQAVGGDSVKAADGLQGALSRARCPRAVADQDGAEGTSNTRTHETEPQPHQAPARDGTP